MLLTDYSYTHTLSAVGLNTSMETLAGISELYILANEQKDQ